MLDHVNLNVRDIAVSRAFYELALAPLGATLIMDRGEMCGFGVGGKPEFWVSERGDPSGPAHVALAAGDRATVDAFYEAALAAGGTDNGPPGVRERYHPTYYGAFVLDPDGNNVEVVCHFPPPDDDDYEPE